MSMRYAGDVIIQTKKNSMQQIEKMFDDHHEKEDDMKRTAASCKQTVN